MGLIQQYINKSDWRIRENSNMSYSYPGLLGYVVGHETAKYALANIYPNTAATAHQNAFIHIHDLNGLAPYCLGLDYEMFLGMGLTNIDGAPKHFTSALGQSANLTFLISQQIAGALAFNSIDVLLGAYIKKDKLTYKEVKQAIQEFVFSINIKGRIGYQSPFLNFQLDITVPKRLKGRNPVIAGEEMPFTYDGCQKEIQWFTQALLEVLMESKSVKAFPVVNIGITPEFDWNSKLAKTVFQAIGRIGQPTINNYFNPNAAYDPDVVKSMCCSLRLDMSQLVKAGVGQFGAADNSGSLGVVTLNLPRYGYLNKGNKEGLLGMIDKYMEIASEALVAKRTFIEDMHKRNMYPTVRRFISDFRNFFNTVGDIGYNEMCLNFMDKGIDTPEGYELSLEVLKFINSKMVSFQERYKGFYGENSTLLFNHELVPGEGVMYRFAKHDKKKYPEIITSNGGSDVYYTRGVWLPADTEYNVFHAAEHQQKLQDEYTGGANFNYYLGEPIYDENAIKSLVYKLVSETNLPFISISPAISECPVCGVKETPTQYCEHDLSEEQLAELKEKGIDIQEV